MKHILVVEDEEHLAIGIKYNLEAEGFHVSTVGDGPAALKIVDEDPQGVDLVILDLMLPGMSGYAVCETLRDAGNEVPVLMLDARTLAEDRIRGFDVGTDQYLQKPFDLDELISRVRNLLQRRTPSVTAATGQPAIETYEFGRAKIDFKTHEVTVDGQSVRLTHMEMKLLRFFVEHQGEVVTRSQLLSDVWGLSSSITTRTVDNFIVRLRKYFERDPTRPRHFLSVRGTGYRFVAAGDDGFSAVAVGQ